MLSCPMLWVCNLDVLMAQSDFADWNIRLFAVHQNSNPDGGLHFPCSSLVPIVPITIFLLKSKTPSSEIRWKRGWKRWCGSSAAYLVASSGNYNCPEIKCMQNQKINRTKPTTQASCIHSALKQEQILMKLAIYFFFWAPVCNLLFLPGSTKPPVSNFCIYALRIFMLWCLTMDSVPFLKEHVQQKVIGIIFNLPSLTAHSSHRVFHFSSTLQARRNETSDRWLWGSTPILQLDMMNFLSSWMLDWWRTQGS